MNGNCCKSAVPAELDPGELLLHLTQCVREGRAKKGNGYSSKRQSEWQSGNGISEQNSIQYSVSIFNMLWKFGDCILKTYLAKLTMP